MKAIIKIFTLAFVLIHLVFYVPLTHAQKVEIIEGVRVVHNEKPKWGNNPKLEIEFVQKIGDLDALDENFQLYRHRDVTRDKSGNIYILDSGNYRIQKYDAKGKYLKTIGRKGQGPSEFNGRPLSLGSDTEDNLYVTTSSMLQVLTSEGRELRRVRFRGSSPHSTKYLTNSQLVAFYEDTKSSLRKGESKEKEMQDKVVKLYDLEMNLVHQFIDPGIYTYKGNSEVIRSCFLADGPDGSIYVTYRHLNSIEKYSPDAKLLMKIDRKLEVDITPKFEEIKIQDYEGINWITPPATMHFGVDDKGRIWVLTYAKPFLPSKMKSDEIAEFLKTGLKLEVFDTDGILLGAMPVGIIMEYMKICGDRIYFIDPVITYAVYEYKIVEK